MRVCARGIIVDSGEVFLCQNSSNINHFWCLPGGGLEENETLRQCLKRELFEEFSVNAEIGKLLVVKELILPYRVKHSHDIEFYFHIPDGKAFRIADTTKASTGKDIRKYGFIPIDELKNITLLPKMLYEIIPYMVKKGFDTDTIYSDETD